MGDNESIRSVEIARNGEELKTPMFDDNMKRAEKAAMANRWKDFKEIIVEKKIKLLDPLDLYGNTTIHVATRSNKPQLLKELIETLTEEERWDALCKGNIQKNTVLHETVFCEEVRMVDVVLQFEKKLRSQKEINGSLLDLKNDKGETPLFRAAKYGKLKILVQMINHIGTHYMEHIPKHLHRGDRVSALYASVIGQYFDVALLLLEMDKTLPREKDKEYFTCLQLLSKMPDVFQSTALMGPVKSLVYYLLPDKYEIEELDALEYKRDLETGKMAEKKVPKLVISMILYAFWKVFAKVISKINYAFWKRFAKEFAGINHTWKLKKKHNLAVRVVDILVENDLSWKKSHNVNEKTLIKMSLVPSNISKRRKQIESKKEENEKSTKASPEENYTPLLIAASTGIVEIVEKILDVHPQAISHVNEDQQNILHVAIMHRQREIFEIIKRKKEHESLVLPITKEGYTILHQAARMDYYREQRHLAGVAFQLQNELRWYDRVKKIVPQHYHMHCDKDNLTAEDVLDVEHMEMLKDAQKWIKETAQSCSTVAVLVATVVFAAAYTIPGGTEGGTPVFLRAPMFVFFTVMDIVALATSLVSVVMFLSILTSSCELLDFRKSLPRKLNFGFALLFFSLVTTMLAFSATILITVQLEWKNWTSTLIYSAAFFPVTVFAVLMFPLYRIAKHVVKMLGRKVKKVLPIRLIKILFR